MRDLDVGPAVVTLRPCEQMLVRLRATPNFDLEPSSVAGCTSGDAPAVNDQRR